ncbi:MAG: hypothetical protein KGH74_01110 [Candidatus Micrarchaeota archaeon]|nr:hypothetical protein [Candidatus Micrarchaeota archaeon]
MDSDAEGLAETASRLMDRKGFDLIVCVPDNPSGTGIALNKYEGIRAVVCGSQSDIEEALSSKANAIIFKSLGARDMQGILGYLMSRHETATMRRPQARQQPAQQQQPQPQQQRQGLFKAPRFKMPDLQKLVTLPEGSGEEPVQDKPAAERQPKVRRKGILGRLKDELGIIDS